MNAFARGPLKWRHVFLWPALLLALAMPRTASAGVVRGWLDVAHARTRFAATQALLPDSLAARAEPLAAAVVCVEVIPPKLEKQLARKAAPAKVLQQGGRFFPRTLCVPVATAVTFLNQDRIYHNIFSVSPARRFDIGRYGPRETRSVTFDATGAVELFCEIHPEELGFIYVTPNHAYARPNSAGGFTLPKLPAGKYTLRVWHPSFGTATKDIELPARGDLVVNVRL